MSHPRFDTLTFEVRGHVVLIGLNRPRKRNAFNLQMLRELSEAYTAYEEDDQLWCALLHAHGDHFTAGLDLAEVGPAVASGQMLFPDGAVDPLDLYGRKRSKPIVQAVQGYCFTIGIELGLACDIRLAADDVQFAQMEVQRGIMPFGGATLRFPKLAGWGNAMRYLLTGERFGADEALRIGVIQEITTSDGLFDRAVALAELVAKQAPLAVQATRTSSRIGVEQGDAEALVALMDQARGLMQSEDAQEGVASFLERREARFAGK